MCEYNGESPCTFFAYLAQWTEKDEGEKGVKSLGYIFIQVLFSCLLVSHVPYRLELSIQLLHSVIAYNSNCICEIGFSTFTRYKYMDRRGFRKEIKIRKSVVSQNLIAAMNSRLNEEKERIQHLSEARL